MSTNEQRKHFFLRKKVSQQVRHHPSHSVHLGGGSIDFYRPKSAIHCTSLALYTLGSRVSCGLSVFPFFSFVALSQRAAHQSATKKATVEERRKYIGIHSAVCKVNRSLSLEIHTHNITCKFILFFLSFTLLHVRFNHCCFLLNNGILCNLIRFVAVCFAIRIDRTLLLHFSPTRSNNCHKII